MPRIAMVIGEYPEAERRRREEVIMSYATGDLEIGFVSVPVSPYTDLTRADVASAAPIFIDAFRRAEQEGYDGVVPLGTLDLGVFGGKAAVSIPVVGPCESMLHVASMLGERFGAITYGGQISVIHPVISSYRMQDRLVGIRSSGFNLPDIVANKDAMVENFLKAGRELVDLGAEVILPMGITQCPIHMSPKWVEEQLGVPVVEGIGTPLRIAAALADLKLASRVAAA